MPLSKEQIKTILPSLMEYDPCSIDISDMEVLDGNRVKAHIDIESAPRDESELFIDGDSSLGISFITGNSSSDNAPTDTIFRTGIVIEKQDMYEDPNLEGLDHDALTIMICGNLSTPEYSDDESDGYLSGTIYIQAGTDPWAEEESRKECIQDIEKSVEDMIRVTSQQVQTLRHLGHQSTIAKATVGDLVRHCLKAA